MLWECPFPPLWGWREFLDPQCPGYSATGTATTHSTQYMPHHHGSILHLHSIFMVLMESSDLESSDFSELLLLGIILAGAGWSVMIARSTGSCPLTQLTASSLAARPHKTCSTRWESLGWRKLHDCNFKKWAEKWSKTYEGKWWELQSDGLFPLVTRNKSHVVDKDHWA